LWKWNSGEKLSLTDQAPGNGSQGPVHLPLSKIQEKATLQGKVKGEEVKPRESENETSIPPNILRPAVNLEFALQRGSFGPLAAHREAR